METRVTGKGASTIQTVSAAWKAAQRKNIVPVSYVEIVLNISDPDAQADALISANGEENFSSAPTLANGIEKTPVAYATFEPGIWTLDGTKEIIPDSPPYGDNGYIGNSLSREDGTYEITPTITVSFTQVFTSVIPGVTVVWGSAYDGECAAKFKVTAYNGSTIVAEKTVTDNTELSCFVDMDITCYNKITVEVLQWNKPFRRARVEKMVLGVDLIFRKSDLMSMGHSMSVDPLSAELPKDEISVTIKNLNGEFNPDNPTGYAKYLMERQRITSRYGYKLDDETEWITGGVFYLSEWEGPQNGITFSFTARDGFEYMFNSYKGPVTGNLYDIAVSAFQQANIPRLQTGALPWSVDDSLKDISAPAGVELNPETNIAMVLQYVANAGCCVICQNRAGVVEIKPLDMTLTDQRIDRFVSYQNADVTISKQLKAVNINDGQYVLNVGEVGETQAVSNPFISDTQAPVVAQWVADYLVNRRTLTGEYRADPRMDALDVVTNQNQYSEGPVLITSIEYSYNGAFRGSYEGRSVKLGSG